MSFARFVPVLILSLLLSLSLSCGDDSPVCPESYEPVEPTQVTSDGASYFDLSPDGNYIAYSDWYETKRLNLNSDLIDTIYEPRSLFPSYSPDGTKLALLEADSAGSHLVILDLQTGDTTIIQPTPGRWPEWSPDGSTIAFAYTYLQLYNVDSGTITNFECADRQVPDFRGDAPTFSPDGDTILFVMGDSLIKGPLSGGNSIPLLAAAGANNPSWSPDGAYILFSADFPFNEGNNLWVCDRRGKEHGLWMLTNPTDDCGGMQCVDIHPRWAADSRTIYFISNRSGAHNIWTTTFEPL